MKKNGRPTKYTETLASEICGRIAKGESVRSIGRDEVMPNASTIFDWALNNEIFSEHYVKAKQIGAEIEAEEIEELAMSIDDVQRAKLVVDTKKWNMSKKLPKRFGDMKGIDITSNGKEISLTQMFGTDE